MAYTARSIRICSLLFDLCASKAITRPESSLCNEQLWKFNYASPWTRVRGHNVRRLLHCRQTTSKLHERPLLRRQNKRFIIRADSVACKCKPIVCANEYVRDHLWRIWSLISLWKFFFFCLFMAILISRARWDSIRFNLEIYNKINYVHNMAVTFTRIFTLLVYGSWIMAHWENEIRKSGDSRETPLPKEWKLRYVHNFLRANASRWIYNVLLLWHNFSSVPRRLSVVLDK